MTRFARARGSKSSNKKEPEEASSWNQLKEGLLKKSDSSTLVDKTQEIQKCKDRIKELQQNDHVSWSTFDDFSGVPSTVENGDLKNKKKKKSADKTSVITNEKSENKVGKKRKEKSIEISCDTDDSTQRKIKKKDKKSGVNVDSENECAKKKKADTIECANDSNKEKNITKKKKKAKGVITSQEKRENKDLNEPHNMSGLIKDDISNVSNNKKANQEIMEPNTSPQKSSTNQNSFPITKNKHKKEFMRKKPLPEPYQMDLNGEMVDVITYDGFPIMLQDAKRLDELKKSLYAKGISNGEIKKIMKLQRRSAEKALTRARKRVCFNCRRSGHPLSECPSLNQGEGTGICFKCGSTEHTHFECRVVKKQEYKFAQCFICKEQGHISNQCPDNPRGLYPKGGACKLCGDVTHLKRFCPTLPKETEPTIDNFLNIEDSTRPKMISSKSNTKKIVQF